MLVLTRKINQSITLGENIRIKVLDVDGERVSIGIDAPREVRVYRSELIEETVKTNEDSVQSELFSKKSLKQKLGADPGSTK